ncbi:uncharacterized protein LOC128986380 [Macrosteles quadrilineatus]|uniref:uncharacterized protein LOC128986380 n=1 Tax=Macrosteles quadrilineatus TaxID=74068 RepID=UPI0023E1DEC5|nr:uncharacterized protein LOC128986380 [Macrosteles quadrilineatus]
MSCAFFICFAILCCLSPTLSLKNKDKPCHQYDPCKCIFPTGRGINLALINKTLSVETETNVSISIHFCGDVSFGNNNASQCFNNVSICYMDNNHNQSFSFGKSADLKFVSESQFEPIHIQFSNSSNTTRIALTCVKELDNPLLIFKSKSKDGSYDLELQSAHSCVRLLSTEEGPSGGLSMGSVLVIMLLVFTLVYFGGGMLTLRILRGAEGKEMIPNIDFWTDLPYLVRDGVLFTLNGFRPQTSYDRI